MPQRFFSFLLWSIRLASVIGGMSVLSEDVMAQGPLIAQTNVVTATCSNSNGSITLVITGGVAPYEYSFNGQQYATYYGSTVFTNLPGGDYPIIVIDFGGDFVTVIPEVGDVLGPTMGATVLGAASCLNDDGIVSVNAIGGTPPFSYSAGGGPYGSAAQLTDVASGTQTITVQDGNGCLASTVLTVPLNNNLVLRMDIVDTTICQGTATSLLITTNGASFTWTPSQGLSSDAIAEPVAEPQTTTIYNLTAVLGICTQTGSETVTVLPAPVPDAGATDSICYGKSAQLQGSGGVQYQWSPATYLSDTASADPIVEQPRSTITYSLTVLGADGCASLQPATVEVFVTPPPVVFAGDDTAVLAGQPLPLDAVDVNNIGFTQYAWSPASGLNTSTVQDPIAQITGNITYTVVATTADGCSGTGSITIAVAAYSDIIVPNAFTPNNDGHNDVLRVDAIGIRDFKYFSVFNRWGQEVFTTSNQGIGWDGTRGGRAQDAGVYVWAAMGLDLSGKQVLRKGTVILIR
jgi:gliding motility-associated-like protein